MAREGPGHRRALHRAKSLALRAVVHRKEFLWPTLLECLLKPFAYLFENVTESAPTCPISGFSSPGGWLSSGWAGGRQGARDPLNQGANDINNEVGLAGRMPQRISLQSTMRTPACPLAK